MLSVAVRTCTIFGYVDLGVQIHGLVVCVGLKRDEFARSSLLDFYFKVMGDLGSALRVFDGLYRIDVVTWNVMISGLVQDGDTSEVLRILSEMQRLTQTNSMKDSALMVELGMVVESTDDGEMIFMWVTLRSTRCEGMSNSSSMQRDGVAAGLGGGRAALEEKGLHAAPCEGFSGAPADDSNPQLSAA
ncbi:hypothetical protein RJ640_018278 [Escallonia rubra]|uniref:Pentatricopeptide repeat-containing protein n=1 Tax=Escallonia rubra TaxID=112253 RepID=A0AA88R066_9ASTE|nr:hypothetical protein RJ640_018278 [Escallonia rubra]